MQKCRQYHIVFTIVLLSIIEKWKKIKGPPLGEDGNYPYMRGAIGVGVGGIRLS